MILKEHSRAQCSRIVQWIGKSQPRFDQLVKLFLEDDKRVAQRAAWPLSDISKSQPHLVKKHLVPILKNINRTGQHDAIKRNTVRLLEDLELPVSQQGKVMALCFEYLIDPAEKPAVKASCISVLHNLSDQYPDIKQELRTILEDRWDLESPAFRARAKKFLQKNPSSRR